MKLKETQIQIIKSLMETPRRGEFPDTLDIRNVIKFLLVGYDVGYETALVDVVKKTQELPDEEVEEEKEN